MGNPRREEPLKEPKTPEVHVPEDFLKKVVENRRDYEKIKKKIEQQRERK